MVGLPTRDEREGRSRAAATAVALAAALVGILTGCASYQPPPPSYQPHLERAQVKEDGRIRVSVAVLSDSESRTMFGVPLAKEEIQAVWVRIENAGTNQYLFMQATLDPYYFSPAEVAYKYRKWCRPKRNARIQEHVESKGMKLTVPARGVLEGVVFANHDPGMKQVVIAVMGEEADHRFEFQVPVPGKRFDYDRVNFAKLYAPEEYRDCGLGELPAILEALPAVTTDKKGTGGGDPLNLVVVTDENDRIASAFSRQGWDPTETLTAGGGLKLLRSFLFGSTWRTSPVSPLYVFGRPQDIALQKARKTIHERNHLRLWLAPFTCEGRHVLVGQISRDIGLRFTTRAPGFVTHKIDPDTDEARDYLTQEMLTSGSVHQMAYVRGVGPASPEEPKRNLTGDPWHTDGLRAVFFLSAEFAPPADAHFLRWHELPVTKAE